MAHEITQHEAGLVCSCGWQHSIGRNKNVFDQAREICAATDAHLGRDTTAPATPISRTVRVTSADYHAYHPQNDLTGNDLWRGW